MWKRLARVGLAFLLPHCAAPYTGAPLGSDAPGAGAGADGGVDGATSRRLTLAGVPDVIVTSGTTNAVPVAVTRDGLDGPVVVSVTGLPPGVDAPPVTIAAADTTASILVSVSRGTTFPITKLTFVATSGEERASQTTNLLLRGKAGSVDDSFGAQGVATAVLGSAQATDLATLADGSYVLLANAASNALLAPIPRDGTRSPVSPSALAFASASACALDAQGGLVVGGDEVASGKKMSLRRYLPTSLDADMGFGASGRVALGEAEATGGVRDVVVREGGFLALHDGARPRVTAVSSTGAVDTAWGTGGVTELAAGNALSLVPVAKSWVVFAFDSARTAYAATPLSAKGGLGNAARVTTSSSALAGVRPRGGGNGDAAYLPVVDVNAGSYGITRYASGLTTVSVDVTSPGLATIVQPDGKVVIAFVSLQRVLLGRFDPDTGARDLGFGATGVVGVAIENASNARIYLQPDGRLVGFANVKTEEKVPAVSMFRVWL